MRNRWTYLSSTIVLAIGLVGIPSNITRAIEVSPPSPVPALSPTVITVNYAAENSFVMVLGVVDGKMYLPEVNDAGPGVLTFSGPPGQYAVMGMEDGKRFQLTVVVEGDNPVPPPIPPPVPGVRSTVIIRESAKDTPGLALAAQKLQEYQNKKKRYNRYLDDDSKDPSGKLLTWVQDLLVQAETAKVPMPALVIGDGSDGVGKVVKIVAMPIEPGAAVAVLKKWGG